MSTNSIQSSQLIKLPHKNNEGLVKNLWEEMKIEDSTLTHTLFPLDPLCQLLVLYVDPLERKLYKDSPQYIVRYLLAAIFGKISGSPAF